MDRENSFFQTIDCLEQTLLIFAKSMATTLSEMKIFQIGFSKCGTCSLFHFFKKNGISSVHWKTEKNENLAIRALENRESDKKFFNGLDYVFYSDMVYMDEKGVIFLYERFEEIYADYPDSKFIFNTRNMDDWIRSEWKHCGVEDGVPWRNIDRLQKILKLDEPLTLRFLRQHYLNHTANVRKFFKDKTDQLLIFKLGENTGEDIANFVTEYDFEDKEFPHANRTDQFFILEKPEGK